MILNEQLKYITILPEIILTVVGMLIMVLDPLLPPSDSRKPIGWMAFAGTLAALAATFYQALHATGGSGFFGMVRMDAFSVFFHVVVILISALAVLSSLDYLEAQNIRSGEYYGLILFGTVGMGLLSSAMELVMLFIALEISSISTYILAGYRRRVAASAESSIKYFLLGSFATAFFLYGVALIYGATGTTNIAAISQSLRAGHISSLAYLALVLMFVGMGFKVAAAPFHVWTPDVYEGAPAPVVALMSTGPKAAAFALMLRVLFGSFGELSQWWLPLIWISAALSMTIGNLGALMQNNVKRMLAYSSIAHAGYLLVAFAARQEMGITAAIFYAASYAAMNLGAFVVVSHFASRGERYVSVDDYAGLGRRSPVLAATLTIFMLSLIGIPLTGGFFAKFYVFSAALKADLVWLTIIGLVNSAVAAYYYLRLIVVMYMKDGDDSVQLTPVPFAVAAALLIAAGLTIYLGIMPGRVLEYATRSAQDLMR
ncbi:MAG: NADH-ubiquinone oxidoreductase chain [Candidatus Angelobacter sp.]|jgi:NADH-quinone oxidoreductase subunit N|nr:NADH-ubiquinone oxidoreductase chain [Candidatus Angelobacter sp.]